MSDPADDDVWYYGTDAVVPALKVDFVSVVLHELGHGLGFIGSGSVDDGTAPNECDGTLNNGCISSPTPFIYDRFVETKNDGTGMDIVDFTTPSLALGTALTGETQDGLFFNGTEANTANGGASPRLYAPNPFESGSSYSHLDEDTFNGTLDALMTPSIATAEANHIIGDIVCGLFDDMGWSIAAPDCAVLLPVELTAFDAVADGTAVILRWETASELNNAGFQVEHRYFDGAFESVDFVAGAGTTLEAQHYSYRLENLEPGRHVFRLKQIDFDGAFEYHPEVEIFVELPGIYALSGAFPNPFNPETQVTLMVAMAQQVRVEVYDVVGRRVALLHDGLLEADELHRFVFDARRLPSGLYLYQVLGERFSDVKTMMLVK